MTYNVSSGTLSLYTTTTTHHVSVCDCLVGKAAGRFGAGGRESSV